MITTPIIDLIIGNKKDSESTFDNDIHSINDNNNIFYYWYFDRMASNFSVWSHPDKILVINNIVIIINTMNIIIKGTFTVIFIANY